MRSNHLFDARQPQAMGFDEYRPDASALFRMNGNGRWADRAGARLAWTGVREDGKEIDLRNQTGSAEHAYRQEVRHIR